MIQRIMTFIAGPRIRWTIPKIVATFLRTDKTHAKTVSFKRNLTAVAIPQKQNDDEILGNISNAL